jgi:hypothetical protein
MNDFCTCRYLRTKRMFINSAPGDDHPTKVDSKLNDESFYWCNQTLTELAADGELAHPRICLPSRPCFKE